MEFKLPNIPLGGHNCSEFHLFCVKSADRSYPWMYTFEYHFGFSLPSPQNPFFSLFISALVWFGGWSALCLEDIHCKMSSSPYFNLGAREIHIEKWSIQKCISGSLSQFIPSQPAEADIDFQGSLSTWLYSDYKFWVNLILWTQLVLWPPDQHKD